MYHLTLYDHWESVSHILRFCLLYRFVLRRQSHHIYLQRIKIIIIIIIKTSRTRPSVKNNIFYTLDLQPHKHLGHGKLKNTTQGNNKTIACSLKPI